MRAPRHHRSESGFTLVEALAALAIFAMAVLVAAAFLQAHATAARRLEVRAALVRATETTLEEIRAGARPLTTATLDRTGELDLPPGARVTTTVRVDDGGVEDLYRVAVRSRSAAAGRPMTVDVQTMMWRP
jgi:prepilin-type N-terminal cleavage/methylation domain-containing protein